ncbi:hypothetical protein DPMN_041618 [Dreissena polymorpha]|uniref:Uncharacterized protein n=1 Tax=Dreissena polymorpha TaxID=45954 RepID=A0A9D4HW80_DREPO|nr:hypothetical protein DPMN_041618 [Dreissena polymorpha]
MSLFHHAVTCELWDVVLQSSNKACDSAANTPITGLRSELLFCDMFNISIILNTVSKEVFGIFRDTSLGILDLRTSECVSQASEIIAKLFKLKKLHVWGTFMSRCVFQLPSSLQDISLQNVDCSSERLCSLLITLSSCGHPVTCALMNVVFQSSNNPFGEALETQASDLRSELISCDMSDITVILKSVSFEIFEIFRDTSIGILELRTSECASQASGIIATLWKLKTLHVW